MANLLDVVAYETVDFSERVKQRSIAVTTSQNWCIYFNCYKRGQRKILFSIKFIQVNKLLYEPV